MPPKMIVDVHTAVPHQAVFELRYDFGQLYFDRTGSACQKIVSENEGWDFGEIGLKGAQLTKADQNAAFSFDARRMNLSQSQSRDVDKLLAIEEFGILAERMAGVVISRLSLSDFTRMGFRMWQLFP